MAWEQWLIIIAAVAAVAALVMLVLIWRVLREAPDARRARFVRRSAQLAAAQPGTVDDAEAQPDGLPRATFIANPTKEGLQSIREIVSLTCRNAGMPEPTWVDTTVDDPGVEQARTAARDGSDVVVAVGGDGTVRAVAQGLAGTSVPLGIIPFGTGNLFARNLGLPLDEPDELAAIALFGRNRTVDLGWLRCGQDPDAPDHAFLVIAGVGFDASMIADTDENLKRRIGWPAYFLGAVKNLFAARARMRVRLDDAEPREAKLKSLLVGNCGQLPAGLNLIPDAEIDDGVLDVAAVDVRIGLLGWWHLYGQVALQSLGIRFKGPGRVGELRHTQARTVVVETTEPEPVQVDGELLGSAQVVSARIDPGALVVRVAETTGR